MKLEWEEPKYERFGKLSELTKSCGRGKPCNGGDGNSGNGYGSPSAVGTVDINPFTGQSLE